MSDQATATAQKSSGPQIQVNLQELLDSLFMVLTDKEAMVIQKRFALKGEQKQTLEKIGKHFNVTRERIRQIESIALSKLKRTVRTTRLDEVNELAKTVLRAHGGVMPEEELVSLVLKRIQGSTTVDGAVLRLSFSIDTEMSSTGRSITFVPFWRLTSLSADDVSLIIDNIVKILRKRKTCMQQEELVSAIQAMNLF